MRGILHAIIHNNMCNRVRAELLFLSISSTHAQLLSQIQDDTVEPLETVYL